MTCECRVECEGTDGAFGATACDAPTITYCPMHAAAPELLAVLRRLLSAGIFNGPAAKYEREARALLARLDAAPAEGRRP